MSRDFLGITWLLGTEAWEQGSGHVLLHQVPEALAILQAHGGDKSALSYLLTHDKILPQATTAPHEASAGRPNSMAQETQANKKARPLLPLSLLITRKIKATRHPTLSKAPRSCAARVLKQPQNTSYGWDSIMHEKFCPHEPTHRLN